MGSAEEGVNKGRQKTKLNFLWPTMARLGPPFLTPKIHPEKFMRVPFLRPFPGNEAHKLMGAQNGAFWVGAKS